MSGLAGQNGACFGEKIRVVHEGQSTSEIRSDANAGNSIAQLHECLLHMSADPKSVSDQPGSSHFPNFMQMRATSAYNCRVIWEAVLARWHWCNAIRLQQARECLGMSVLLLEVC
jgi:hypothetical protein